MRVIISMGLQCTMDIEISLMISWSCESRLRSIHSIGKHSAGVHDGADIFLKKVLQQIWRPPSIRSIEREGERQEGESAFMEIGNSGHSAER